MRRNNSLFSDINLNAATTIVAVLFRPFAYLFGASTAN
jgi:hypothetical protein